MKKQYWIFTFGCGQENAGRYVKIAGSYGEARAKMCEKYGTAWAFQYSEKNGRKILMQSKKKWR